MESWRIENMVTITATALLVAVLFALSDSWHSLWGMLLMLNINH